MRLVRMLGGCALLAWPSSGGARAARPAIFPLAISQSATSQPTISQTAISQTAISETAPQDSPAASPPSQTAPGTAAPPAAEPAAETPPASGPQKTPSPRKPEAQAGQTAAPSRTRPSTETAKPSSTVRHASSHRPQKKPASATAAKAAPPGAHPGQKSTPDASPKKVVVRNGGASDSSEQLSPGLTAQQASSQRQTIDLLLVDTATNLKKLAGRQTTPGQDDMMGQVRQYVQQAKTAADAGDIERAHNLAVKAHLLSEELAKH